MSNSPTSPQFYKTRLQEMGNPSAGPWAKMALDYWTANLPDLTKQLKAINCLKEATIVAQEDAKNLYAELVGNGFDPRGAQEIALKEFVLIDPPEQPDPMEQSEGEANQLEAFQKMLDSTQKP